jgi:rhamnosyl/mannosyltransferase
VKILHLGKFDTLGGIERHVKTLARGLVAKSGVEVVNLVSADSKHRREHHDYGYPTISVPCHGVVFSLALSPSLPFVARELHRAHRFDVVHLHFPDPVGHLTALALPRSVRRVISWHSDIVRQQHALAVYGPFLRRFVRDADAIIGATPQHLERSAQLPPARRGQVRRVIPYGFDSTQYQWSDAARARRADLLKHAAGRQIIFSLGRHVYYKGFDVLIKAMSRINALLVIGGTGPLTTRLKEQAAQIRQPERVLFAGYIPDPELVAYFDVADVFVMPSTDRSEAFGIVQLEAMYFRRPVVATRLGTGVEYVNLDGVTGLLVPPDDAGALEASIDRLLSDAELRARLGAAGHRRVTDVFSVERMVDATLDVYRQVLA